MNIKLSKNLMMPWVILVALALAWPAAAAERPGSFADLVQKVSPAVVNIRAERIVKAPGGAGFIFAAPAASAAAKPRRTSRSSSDASSKTPITAACAPPRPDALNAAPWAPASWWTPRAWCSPTTTWWPRPTRS